MTSWPLFPFVLASVLAALAAVTDLRSGKIPNLLTLPALLAALPYHWVMQPAPLVQWLLGVGLSALVPVLLFACTAGRAIGGGDVKLFAALGAWLGPSTGVELQFASMVLVCVIALVGLAWRGRLLATFAGALRIAASALRLGSRRPPEPELCTQFRMGPAIFLATLGVTAQELFGVL